MDITGTIVLINQQQVISEKFTKRMFVVEVPDGEYSELISLEFVQDKVSELDKFAEGQEVTVGFNLKGRKWVNPQGEAKYFNTLQAWKINATAVNAPSAEQSQAQNSTAAPQPEFVNPPAPTAASVEEDDIPF
jgi:hypothetical protein